MKMGPQTKILDTHIHLFPTSEIDQLAWQTSDGPLSSQHSLDEYSQAVQRLSETGALAADRDRSSLDLEGFIFVETDRTSGIDPSQWHGPLNEIRYLSRIALGKPRVGEGHEPEHAKLCKGIVPWAPLPGGVEALREYRRLAYDAMGEASKMIKGWRYLVQDKEDGIMLEESFVLGLRQIGEWGEVFDLGVDYHRRGEKQLIEAAECLKRVYNGSTEGKQVKIVINHMCKPNMLNPGLDETWRRAIERLASFPTTYMKLSGAFSEIASLPPHGTPDQREAAYQKATEIIHNHMDFAWDAFGPNRCMFGSDWPVCNVGLGHHGKEELAAWGSWMTLVEQWALKKRLSEAERANFFAKNAMRIYDIES